MATSTSVNRETFLANLRASGLLSSEQLAAVSTSLPDSDRGRVLARALVELGWLTRFQAQQLLAGRVNGFVLGQYRILDQLGRGGMGQVFKAIHQTMNRTVALKVLAPNVVDTERAQTLFLREMQAAAQLLHPNIVTAYDANQIGSRYYLVMEYVDGPNLEKLVREQGPLPVGQACDFIRQAAQGLQHASQMGMVHRDIKPANLLVQRNGEAGGIQRCTVKILDFGLARLGGQGALDSPGLETIVARKNVVMGTPDFVSPEQARNLHGVDIRSDLYSLGCTFYYILSGKTPFPGGTSTEKVLRHATEPPVPLETVRPDAPASVAAIVNRLLAKNPADRFQTPAELSAALAPLSAESGEAWSIPEATAADIPLATPSVLSDAGLNFDDAEEGHLSDVAVAANTLPDLGPTSISSTRLPGLNRGLSPAELADRRRLKIAFGVATAIVLSAVLIAALVFWR